MTSRPARSSITGGADVCPEYWSCTGKTSVGDQSQHYVIPGYQTSPNGGNVAGMYEISSTYSTLSQNITSLIVGNTYTVSFQEELQNGSTTSFNGTAGLAVSVGGQTIDDTQTQIPVDYALPWETITANFVATAATETLQFLAQASVATAPQPAINIDGVQVVAAPVPEPSTFALLLGGVAALAFLTKRRKA